MDKKLLQQALDALQMAGTHVDFSECTEFCMAEQALIAAIAAEGGGA